MSQFLKNHGGVIVAVTAGAVIGASVVIIYQKIADDTCRQLRELVAKIEHLRQEIEELKNSSGSTNKKKRLTGYYSIHASSGDEDDDIYEEAVEGFIDYVQHGVDGYHRTEFETAKSLGVLESTPLSNGEAFSGSLSKDARDLYTKIDELLEGSDSDKTKAYNLLCEREQQLNGDDEFMWRFAKATYMVAAIQGASQGEEAKKTAIYKAQDHATRALHINESNANVHKWYAITIAGVGDYESTQVKLQNGFKYREHIEKAIELNPKDASSYYLLGRWLFAVYMLSWIERQAAATLFGASISASVDDALKQFMEAEKLDPGNWKDNLLHIAKCHIELRDYYTAVTWMDKADKVPTVSQDDKVAQKELDTLLYKYSGYRT